MLCNEPECSVAPVDRMGICSRSRVNVRDAPDDGRQPFWGAPLLGPINDVFGPANEANVTDEP